MRCSSYGNGGQIHMRLTSEVDYFNWQHMEDMKVM